MTAVQAMLILAGVVLCLVDYVPGVNSLPLGVAVLALGFGLPIVATLGG